MELHSLPVCRFPTIYLARAGRKDEPLRYEVRRRWRFWLGRNRALALTSCLCFQGPRELRDFLKFLRRELGRSLRIDGSKDEL